MARWQQALIPSMVRAMHPARLTSFLLLLLTFMCVPALQAQAPNLTSDEQAHLAQQFAPVLVFHSAEKFFPASPLFSIDAAAPGADKEITLRRLGTTESRTSAYLATNLADRAKLATVFYRAYPARRSGRPVVVLEYWFYYVRDEYRVRSNVLPIWAGANHPNDLEHVHLVLHQEASGKFVAGEAYASAHEGKIPANHYNYGETGHEGSTHFLVELGSHALAPDIDNDGIFTPGADGDSGYKVQWGIRDRGYSWPRYRSSYMSPRANGNAVVFAEENAVDSKAPQFSYRLASVDSLNESFARLDLSTKQRKNAFESPTFWFPRIFGRDNGRSKKLLIPSRPKSGGKSVGIQGVSSSERLLLAGTALNLDDQGIFIGGRYSFLTRPLFVPDLVLEADSIWTRHKKYLTPQFLLSYPLDGFTRIMVGRSLTTDSWNFNSRQWDTVGTIEVRLGDMRISATSRSIGPLRGGAKEFRLFYSFQ